MHHKSNPSNFGHNPGRGHNHIIAIDGPAAAGKGTAAEGLAQTLGFVYCNTGNLYRHLASVTMDRGINLHDPAAERIIAPLVAAIATDHQAAYHIMAESHPELHSNEIGSQASMVAALPSVRQSLVAIQRSTVMSIPEQKVVVDGRDMGSAIFPEARCKIFVTGDVATRALRRFNQLQSKGIEAIHDVVLQSMVDRDRRDGTRASAPMVITPGTFVVDTSHMEKDEVLQTLISIALIRLG